MTAKHDLDRRLRDHYAAEAPGRAPDWVLESALAAIDSTPQRHVRLSLPRRFTNMHAPAKFAIAAVVIVAAGLVGLAILRPGQGPSVGGPALSPSAMPSDSPLLSPSAPSSPTPSPYVPPALSETFTSTIHGVSISYPAGWTARAATEPWTTGQPMFFQDPAADHMYDPRRTDHLFLGLASWNLAGTTFDEWSTSLLAAEGCDAGEAATVDGAPATVDSSCGVALVSSGGRGYLFRLYRSADDPDLGAFDAASWFSDILETVRLSPEDALDASASASPSP